MVSAWSSAVWPVNTSAGSTPGEVRNDRRVQEVYTGKGTPPKELKTDADVKAFVAGESPQDARVFARSWSDMESQEALLPSERLASPKSVSFGVKSRPGERVVISSRTLPGLMSRCNTP